jgi:hypothetical protein
VGAFEWNQPNNWKTVLVMLANFHKALKRKTLSLKQSNGVELDFGGSQT